MENGSGGVARVHTIRTMRRRLTTDYNAESKNQNTLISATWLGSRAGNKTFSASAPRARYRETSTFGDTCGTVYVRIRSLFIRPPFSITIPVALFIWISRPVTVFLFANLFA